MATKKREKRPPSPAKQRRIDAQREREQENARRRANGQPTPWQERKADRKARRAKMRAEGTLVQQKRENGKVVKVDEAGNVRLVECCPNCTRRGLEATAVGKEARRDRKEQAAKKQAKAKKATKRMIKAPRQIMPKEAS